jgi:hypothetical protein
MKHNKFNTKCFICENPWSYNKYSIFKVIKEINDNLEEILIKIKDILIKLIVFIFIWSSGFLFCSFILIIMFAINPLFLLNNLLFHSICIYIGTVILSKCII